MLSPAERRLLPGAFVPMIELMKKIEIPGSWLSRRAVTIVLGIAVAGVTALVLIQHRAHLARLLPFAAILLCLLMHLFMHGKHSGHDHGEGSESGEKGTTPHRHD